MARSQSQKLSSSARSEIGASGISPKSVDYALNNFFGNAVPYKYSDVYMRVPTPTPLNSLNSKEKLKVLSKIIYEGLIRGKGELKDSIVDANGNKLQYSPTFNEFVERVKPKGAEDMADKSFKDWENKMVQYAIDHPKEWKVTSFGLPRPNPTDPTEILTLMRRGKVDLVNPEIGQDFGFPVKGLSETKTGYFNVADKKFKFNYFIETHSTSNDEGQIWGQYWNIDRKTIREV